MAKNHGPTIQDDRRYEALKKQGMSKQKAARIANTPASTAGKRGGKAQELRRYDQGRALRPGQEGRDLGSLLDE